MINFTDYDEWDNARREQWPASIGGIHLDYSTIYQTQTVAAWDIDSGEGVVKENDRKRPQLQ